MNHQVGVSGVHHIYVGSNLVPVLDLRPLNKFARVYQIYLHSPGTPKLLCFGTGSQGVVRVRSAESVQLTETNIWLCDGRVLH